MDDENKVFVTLQEEEQQPEHSIQLDDSEELITPNIENHAENVEEAEDDYLSAYELNEVIEALCLSKVEEFKMLGYEYVSGKDIWECVSDKYRKKGIPSLHQIVNDILSLKSTAFMNWMTMSAYKGAQF
jgi:hypothetical protein